MAPLTAEKRKDIQTQSFAYPEERKYPVHDADHVRSAISYFPRGVPQEKRRPVAARIRSAAKKFGVEIDKDSSVAKMSEGDLAVLQFSEGPRGDGLIPVARTGQWVFDTYGPWKIEQSDLDDLVRNFHDRVYGQDLPIVNEDHDHSRAVGWLEDVVRDGDWVFGKPKWNSTGAELVANDSYRYTSPELMRGWTDPVTGQSYSLILSGLATGDNQALALTNHPRIKALAMGEEPAALFSEVAGVSPEQAAKTLFAEDMDGDSDGPEPCVHQPGFGSDCVAFTRYPGDDDGDGGCLLAERGCNAYRAASAADVPIGITRGISMSEKSDETPQGTSPPVADAVKPPEGGSPAPNEADQARADMSETTRLLAAEKTKREELERRVAEMSERERQRDARERLLKASERIEGAVRAGRLTPAQRDTYIEKVAMLSEESMQWFLDDLDKRPQVIPMSEHGSGTIEGSASESERLDNAAKALMSERNWDSKRYKDALLEVSSRSIQARGLGFRG